MNTTSRSLLVALLAVTSTVHSADTPKTKTTYENNGSKLRILKHEMISHLITAAMGIATIICYAVIILF